MHLGKLKSKWYGPNVVETVYPYRTVEIIDKNGISFKVNEQRLKKYYDGRIDTEDKEIWDTAYLANLTRIDTFYKFRHTAYPGPRWKEIDNAGGVTIIWNPTCVVVMLASRRIYNTHSCSYTQHGESG
ncbi:hypothetical protein Tco_1223352 [Tanacetum coccineum]